MLAIIRRPDILPPMSDSPVRILSDHPTAVLRREMRLDRREPAFDVDVATDVLDMLARGVGLGAIGDIAGFPAYGVVNFWRNRYPDFDEACVLASEAGADALAWENVEIADDDSRSPANKALSIAVRERLSKVLNRKKYDPAVKVEVTGNARDADELTDAELAAAVRRGQRARATDAVIVQPSDGDGDGSGS